MKKIMKEKILICSFLCIIGITLVACRGNTKDAKNVIVDTTTKNQNASADVLLEEKNQEINNETNNDIENAEIHKSDDENQHFRELYDLVQLWSELFSNHEAYGLIPLYSDGATLNSLVYYDESYGQLEEKLYRDIDPNWTMRKEDCEYQYGDNTATIWYYVKVNEVKTIVIKETLTTGYVNGVLRVIEEKHEIYDEVKTKIDYDNAYTIIEDSNTYYDFYKYLCDEVIVNQNLIEYFEPGTAAEQTLNLSGGLVSKVEYFYEGGEDREAVNEVLEQGKDGKIRFAEVTYQFSNGELAVIPMYKTYTNVWFPVSLGSLSSHVNEEFMKVTKEDYENAVSASEFRGDYSGTSQRLCLLADFDSVLVYGTDSNYVIIIQDEVARPYNISWYSPLFTEPKISFMDSNEDGEKEIYCSMHIGTGTGVSVDFLYVFDRASSGSYQCYEFDSYDYIKMLQACFFYTYEKDTDQIQYYVNGRPEGEAFTMYEAIYGDDGVVNNEREKLTFERITLGDFISFDVTKDIIITAELEGMAKEYVIPAFYQGSLRAKVHYYNDGKFYLTDTMLISSEENEEEKNKHLVMIPNGEGYSCDLDGDGVMETLHYDRYEKENEYNYIETLPLLTINDEQYDMEALSELGAYLSNSDYGEWYIADLDVTDSYKEIALYDDGPSGDPATYFLRYENGKLTYIGAVGDMPKASSFSVNGDGSVNSKIRLAIYQTWWADTIYSFNEEGKLVEQRPEWYRTYIWRHSGYTEEYFVQDVELYESPSLDAKSISLSAGTEVYLTATDDEHWIQVTTTDWQKAWFYVEGYDSVQLPSQTLPVEEFISYRCLAD